MGMSLMPQISTLDSGRSCCSRIVVEWTSAAPGWTTAGGLLDAWWLRF